MLTPPVALSPRRIVHVSPLPLPPCPQRLGLQRTALSENQRKNWGCRPTVLWADNRPVPGDGDQPRSTRKSLPTSIGLRHPRGPTGTIRRGGKRDQSTASGHSQFGTEAPITGALPCQQCSSLPSRARRTRAVLPTPARPANPVDQNDLTVPEHGGRLGAQGSVVDTLAPFRNRGFFGVGRILVHRSHWVWGGQERGPSQSSDRHSEFAEPV